uniref:Cytochrome P450 n=1 Tax=Ciona savignyi TaxID=51511 RepID=H2YUX3_CIOSA
MDDYICLITVLLILIYLWLSWYRKPKNFPPGPRGLPILGIVPYLGKHPEKVLSKLADKYNPSVMSFRMGRMDWIILNDIEAINQALVKQGEDFSGRPKSPLFDMLTNGCGLVFVDGERWKEQRKFGIMALRSLGMGKRILDEIINKEFEVLANHFESSGSSIDAMTSLRKAVTNITCEVLMGKRFEYNDPVMEIITEHRFVLLSIMDLLHNILVLFFKLLPDYHLEVLLNTINSLAVIQEIIESHKRNFDQNNKKDFVDYFIDEMLYKEGNYFTSTNFIMQDEQLCHYTRDLLVAGINTTTALGWGIVCLLLYRGHQTKIAKEIQQVIGDETPTLHHQDRMPHLRSFIQEVHRCRSIATLNLPHRTTRDVRLNGYDIPKNTPVLTNIWRVHNDPRVWKDPHKFNPGRHLDSNGKFVHSAHIIPFACGYRRCLGERIARAEMFIFFAKIIGRFELNKDDGEPLTLDNDPAGAVNSPKPFRFTVRRRS